MSKTKLNKRIKFIAEYHLYKIKTIITNTVSKDTCILKDTYKHIRVDV